MTGKQQKENDRKKMKKKAERGNIMRGRGIRLMNDDTVRVRGEKKDRYTGKQQKEKGKKCDKRQKE